MLQDTNVRAKINAIKQHQDPMAQAQLVVELLKAHTLKQVELAQSLDMKPSYLSHLIRVTKLPEMVLDGYWNKHLTFTHLILISRLRKVEDITTLYEEILKDNLNVAATERRIREMLYLIDTVGKYISKDRLDSIQSRIRSSLGDTGNISIIQTRIKAKIVIEVPGNLVATSEFIESFGARFRNKRQKLTGDSESPTPPVHALSHQAPESSVDEAGESLIDDDADPKKFRFDPDF